MPRGVILVDWTDQGRRTIKDSPDRAEATKAEAAKLAWQKGVRVSNAFADTAGLLPLPRLGNLNGAAHPVGNEI